MGLGVKMGYIKINNTVIQLNTRLTINLLNPLFYEMNSYSLPFTIPYSDDIASILGNPELINISDANEKFTATLVNDTLQFVGYIYITKANRKTGYNAYFIGELSFNEFGKQSLRDLEWLYAQFLDKTTVDKLVYDFPEVSTPPAPYAYDSKNGFEAADAKGEISHVFVPVNNNVLNENYPVAYLNYVYNTVNYYSGTKYRFSFKKGPTDVSAVVPFPKLTYIIRNIFNFAGLDVTRDVTKVMPDFDDIYLLSKYSLNSIYMQGDGEQQTLAFIKIEDGEVFAYIAKEYYVTGVLFFDGFPAGHYLNKKNIECETIEYEWPNSKIKLNIDDADVSKVSAYTGTTAYFVKLLFYSSVPDVFPFKQTLPHVTINNFLKWIGNYFGIVFFINNSYKNVSIYHINELLSSNNVNDISHLSAPIDEAKTESLKPPGYHMKSNIDTSDTYYDQMVNDFDPDVHIIADPVATYNDLPGADVLNTIRLVEDEDTFYLFNSGLISASGSWSFFSKNIVNDETVGDGEYSLETNVSCPIQIGGKIRADYQLNDTMRTGLKMEFIRPFFFRGLKKYDAYNHAYPLVHTNNVDQLGNQVGKFSMAWKGTYGRKEVLFKPWLNFLSNRHRNFNHDIHFQSRHLQNFNFARMYRIFNTRFFIAKIPVIMDLGANTNTTKTAECVRV